MASDFRLFFQEFRRTYHTTGAIAPSGRRLAASLARFVADGPGGDQPRRILEVGPGTGSVTRSIIQRLRAGDRLDLVELNDRFVARLRERLEGDPLFRPVAERVRVLHQSVEQLEAERPYDLIISGLPLNNFTPETVQSILAAIERLLAPGGVLSFFEYIAIRPARALVSGRQERQRLADVGRALDALLRPHEIRRDWIWPNLPPAWVHHVRIDAARAPLAAPSTSR